MSFLAHEYLPWGPDLFGHSAALWLALAVYAGYRARSAGEAAAAGGLGLVLTVATFYLALRLLAGRGDFPAAQAFWFASAVAGGPVYGWLGHLFHSPQPWIRGFVNAAVGATFVSEAFAYSDVGGPGLDLTIEAVLGVALALALSRTRRQLLATSAWLPALVILGVAGWRVVQDLFELAT